MSRGRRLPRDRSSSSRPRAPNTDDRDCPDNAGHATHAGPPDRPPAPAPVTNSRQGTARCSRRRSHVPGALSRYFRDAARVAGRPRMTRVSRDIGRHRLSNVIAIAMLLPSDLGRAITFVRALPRPGLGTPVAALASRSERPLRMPLRVCLRAHRRGTPGGAAAQRLSGGPSARGRSLRRGRCSGSPGSRSRVPSNRRSRARRCRACNGR